MKITKTLFPTALALAALCATARADVLELKNGQVLNGKYAGGTAGTIRFNLNTGLQVIETSQIIALTFTTTGAPTTPTAAATPAPAPAPGQPLLPRPPRPRSPNPSRCPRARCCWCA